MPSTPLKEKFKLKQGNISKPQMGEFDPRTYQEPIGAVQHPQEEERIQPHLGRRLPCTSQRASEQQSAWISSFPSCSSCWTCSSPSPIPRVPQPNQPRSSSREEEIENSETWVSNFSSFDCWVFLVGVKGHVISVEEGDYGGIKEGRKGW